MCWGGKEKPLCAGHRYIFAVCNLNELELSSRWRRGSITFLFLDTQLPATSPQIIDRKYCYFVRDSSKMKPSFLFGALFTQMTMQEELGGPFKFFETSASIARFRRGIFICQPLLPGKGSRESLDNPSTGANRFLWLERRRFMLCLFAEHINNRPEA